MVLTAIAGFGWQHGFGDTPSVAQAFTGGTDFTALGAPRPRIQFATGLHAHALTATWNSRF